MSHEILKITGLETGYGRKQILYGIDIQVQTNEMVAIIGHNGAGKSTLLKAVFGLIPVWKGSVHYHGQEVTAWPPSEKIHNGLAYVPQGNRVFGELSVLDPQPRMATVVAETDVRLLCLDRELLFEAMADRPEVAQGVIRFLCRRYREGQGP